MKVFFSLVVLGVFAITTALAAEKASTAGAKSIAHGRYLVKITGCNDCHTAGYAQVGGEIPERAWLTGDVLGFRGPWGTTYPTNLRLLVQGMTEDEWVVMAKKLKTRPPMPWFTMNEMTDADLRSIFRYIRHLGPAGNPAPAYLPPHQEPHTPFIVFVPQMPNGEKAK